MLFPANLKHGDTVAIIATARKSYFFTKLLFTTYPCEKINLIW